MRRFATAVQEARLEIEEQLDSVGEEAAAILETHLLMLGDPLLIDATTDRIRTDHLSAENALSSVVSELSDSLRQLDDEYLRNRASDVDDVGSRLRRRMRDETQVVPDLAGAVVVARDLTPSEVISCRQAGVVAVATEAGAANSHAAILARSLKLPAVVGVHGLLNTVMEGTAVLVDGDVGEVSTVDAHSVMRRADSGPLLRSARTLKETRTADGRRVRLYANLGRAEEIDTALEAGAEGIGVLRTEFLFLEEPPSEQQQYQTYRDLAERLGGKPLVVRTLDVGGDKPLPYLPSVQEANPFLGLRGVRLSLAHPELFRTQLRAVLRAGAHGSVHLMYPMVTDVSELMRANALLARVSQELQREGVPISNEVQAGTMIEVPAAALCADQLAAIAAFLSVGTNDLAQYTLAADRNSPMVAGLYCQTHPAVLRLLRLTVEGAHRWHRPVAVCGEIAADLSVLPLLVGLGVDELSVAPSALLSVRAALQSISYAEAVELTRDL